MAEKITLEISLDEFIGRKLKQARKEKYITQAQLAKKLKMATVTIASYEAGIRSLNAVKLLRIATVLEKKIDYFFPPQIWLKK